MEGKVLYLSTFNEEYELAKKHWEVLAYFIYDDGTKELIREIDHNIVVNNLSIAIACLMKQEPGYQGILYWALGSGRESWPANAPEEPLETDASLANETYRKAISTANISFIDANNVVSVDPTGRLQITILFDTEEANGKLMEFGLYAGNATSVRNSGFMVNHKTHPEIIKTNTVKLEYTIRLTF